MENIAIQTLLKERYRVIRELGKGGMGVVYLAHDEQLLSKPVVIKILSENSYSDEWIRRKFRQEIEALTRIDHPGVVGVIDAGELIDGRPFVVMQFIEGCSLRELMTGTVGLERIAGFMKQLGPALAAAHAQGVLHRDLKPENIMIQNLPGGQEQVKLIDFGLARVRASKIGESSVAQNVVGSFGYMSPEQLTGKDLSSASDVYSLGAIAYEMVTGRMPFHPESVFELYEKQKANEVIPPSDLRRDLPLAAQTIILRSISFDVEKRYSNALDFCNQLSEALMSGKAAQSSRNASAMNAPPTAAARLLPVVLNLVTFLPFLKFYFSRFMSWQYFLMEPGSLCTVAIALFSAIAIRKIDVSRKVLATLFLPIGIWLLLILSLPPVIRISNQSGRPADLNHYSLSYSDPRGYKYTVVESKYCLITINPGGFNHLSDYTLQLILSPPLEFSDVFFDRRFGISNQLLLQPSSTNDILLIHNTGDDFYNIRSVALRYKYRIREEDNRITVHLKAGNQEISSEQKLPL